MRYIEEFGMWCYMMMLKIRWAGQIQIKEMLRIGKEISQSADMTLY